MNDEKSESTWEAIKNSNVVYTDIDEDIAGIFAKIVNRIADDIYLVIPAAAVVLQSPINLQILQRKLTDINKRFAIISCDERAKYWSEKLNIPAFKNLKGEELQIDDYKNVAPAADDQIRFTQQRPQRREQPKKSIDQLKRDLHNESMETFMQKAKEHLREFKKNRAKKNILVQNPHKQAMLTLLGGGILLLCLIVYIALPSSTIYITPNRQIVEQAVNITLADVNKASELINSGSRRILAAHSIAPSQFVEVIDYETTGRIFEGTNARGQITVFNEADFNWDLVARTQFHTDSGIVFRAVSNFTVPAGTPENPGKTLIDVVADEFDAAGKAIGERGNIMPSNLKIAKLPPESQKQVYGRNEIQFTGGSTITRVEVTEADLNNAKELAKKKLLEQIPDLLSNYIQTNEQYAGRDLVLLNINQAIVTSEPQVIVNEEVLGTDLANFPVTVKMYARGLAFNETNMLTLLKNELLLRQSPDRKLIQIDNKGISYRVVDRDDEEGTLSVTATIKGVEAFDIDLDKEEDAMFLDKIKQHILGRRIEEAELYLENLIEVEKVRITRWPFWAPSMPTLADNIRIVIEEVKPLEDDVLNEAPAVNSVTDTEVDNNDNKPAEEPVDQN